MSAPRQTSANPFSRVEWLIAWRYMRAKKAEGGVSTMSWISLIGITLAVFALVAALAVRAGLRADFVEAMLGGNAHIELRYFSVPRADGPPDALIRDYEQLRRDVEALPRVIDAAPVIRSQVLSTFEGRNAPADIYGISLEDLQGYERVTDETKSVGDLSRLPEGIAIGSSLALDLGVLVGDRIRLVSPDGARTPFGIFPRASAYEVVYIFSTGQPFMDKSRIFMPLPEAQRFFNREGGVDQIDLRVTEPEKLVEPLTQLQEIMSERGYALSWQDRFGGILQALRLQDSAIFLVLAIVVLIASLNIVSGLIMLVKNKGRDIGILRTMGFSENSILRIFFLCGALIGTISTVMGVLLGAIFAANIESVYRVVNWITGNRVDQLEGSGFIFPSAILQPFDVFAAALLSLTLSWLVTFFPARRAAKLNPVEALRYE